MDVTNEWNILCDESGSVHKMTDVGSACFRHGASVARAIKNVVGVVH